MQVKNSSKTTCNINLTFSPKIIDERKAQQDSKSFIMEIRA